MTISTAEIVNESANLGLYLTIGSGFILAIGFGSIAWYNSNRPLGWKDKKRPNIVPEVETKL